MRQKRTFMTQARFSTREVANFPRLLPHNTAWRKRAGGPPGLWISVPNILASWSPDGEYGTADGAL